MRNAGRHILLAVLIPIFAGTVVALPSFLQGQVKLAGEVAPKTATGDFVGPETCKTCHPDPYERFSATTM